MSGMSYAEKRDGITSRKRCRPWVWLGIPVLILILAACRSQEPPPPPEEPVAATVNGQQIRIREFQEKLAEAAALAKVEAPLKAGEMQSLKEEAINLLIEERLMLHRVRELAIAIGEEELAAGIEEVRREYNGDGFSGLFGEGRISYPAWKEALRKRLLLEKLIALDVNAKIAVPDADAERHFQANRKTYMTAVRVRAAQIVIRDRDRAEAILKRLKTGEDFGKVAREVSIGPESAKGGDLGFFERGTMPEAIDRVVFSMPVGKLSGVVQSPYGYHIFKLLALEKEGGRTFAEVKERVIADLRKLREADAYEQWIDGLKARAQIRINRPLPDGPPPALPDAKATNPPAGAGRH
jgi:parvulin-like peptidyl-prolyl isomerase